MDFHERVRYEFSNYDDTRFKNVIQDIYSLGIKRRDQGIPARIRTRANPNHMFGKWLMKGKINLTSHFLLFTFIPQVYFTNK